MLPNLIQIQIAGTLSDVGVGDIRWVLLETPDDLPEMPEMPAAAAARVTAKQALPVAQAPARVMAAAVSTDSVQATDFAATEAHAHGAPITEFAREPESEPEREPDRASAPRSRFWPKLLIVLMALAGVGWLAVTVLNQRQAVPAQVTKP